MPAIAFDRFYRYADLTALLNAFVAENPGLVSIESIGKSHEGRDIWVVTVTNTTRGPAAEKPAFWVDGNIHATEVAASAASLYFLHTLATQYGKDPTDPQWANDKGMQDWRAWMAKYFPSGDVTDASNVYGYSVAMTVVQVLKQCGDNLTRENVMKQAASLKDFEPDTMLPGVKLNTSATDFAPISQLQLQRFKGEKWDLFGDVISADVGG
jgi:hypothetical protein